MKEFLLRCFTNFEVAFWNSKSNAYMADILPAVMGRFTKENEFRLVFVWSGRQCAPIAYDDGTPSEWGKPLEKVFQQYPCWSHSNTVIIDHKAQRVGSNPSANVIILTPFYVEKMERLGEDQNFLKSSLWPLLQGLFGSTNVADFRSHFPLSFHSPNAPVHRLYEKEETSGFIEELEGEGTYGPLGPC
jgi:hypothetical protein